MLFIISNIICKGNYFKITLQVFITRRRYALKYYLS
nr:MAG TPA: hypothetical protein [Microviridae sp.]